MLLVVDVGPPGVAHQEEALPKARRSLHLRLRGVALQEERTERARGDGEHDEQDELKLVLHD